MWVRFPPSVLKAILIGVAFVFASPPDSAVALDSAQYEIDPEHWGLTRTEYRKARDVGLSPERIVELLSLGVRPAEYLDRPWLRLGISEREWLRGRESGLEDADLDESAKMRVPLAAWQNGVLPGWGEWSSGRPVRAGLFSGLAVAAWGAAIFLVAKKDPAAVKFAYVGAGVHLLSFSFGFVADKRMPVGKWPPFEERTNAP